MPEHSSNPQLQQRVLRQALLERAFVQALEQDIITDLYLLVLALAPNPEQITREGYEGTRSVTPEAQSAEESEGDSRSPEQPDPSALLKDAVTSGWQLTGGSLNSVGWRGERGPNDSAGASRRGLERSPLPVTGPALNIASSGRSSILPRGHALNAYDNVGNLTKKTSALTANTPDPKQAELTYDLSYTYDGKPHQATHVGTQHYQYDENGNLTTQTPDWAWNGTTADPLTFVTTTLTPGKAVIDQAIGENRTLVTTVKTGVRRLTWDWDNRLRKVKDDQIEVSYDYDVDGERRLKTLGTSETVYADKMQQIDIGGAVPLATVNIYLGDTRLVSKLVPLDKPSVGYEKDNTFYYHADHIGNSTLITNSKGQEYQRFQFTPHGEIWHEDSSDAVSQIDYLFTGKQVDSETGWYNFGARYMDPKTGLWLSSDPALDEYIPRAPLTKEDKEANGKLPGNGGIYNPVNFALYHFAGNNPIRYVDPDGNALYAALLFDKSSQTLTLTISSTTSTQTITRTFNASNNPSQRAAPAEKYTSPAVAGESSKNYKPQKFPNGTWNVYAQRAGHDKFEGTINLKTDATQMVDVYSQKTDDAGNISWAKDGKQLDGGYNIHDGLLDYSDWTKTTLGCIRVETATIKELASLLTDVQKSGGKMTLTVQE